MVTGALFGLGMIDKRGRDPLYQATVRRSVWVRATAGGLLDYHVAPGDVVEKGQAVATSMTLLGEEQHVITAPFGGVVIGMTTLPAVMPGDPVIHLGQIVGGYRRIMKVVKAASSKTLHERLRTDLQTNVVVVERDD
jgi:predicted deacylase